MLVLLIFVFHLNQGSSEALQKDKATRHARAPRTCRHSGRDKVQAKDDWRARERELKCDLMIRVMG